VTITVQKTATDTLACWSGWALAGTLCSGRILPDAPGAAPSARPLFREIFLERGVNMTGFPLCLGTKGGMIKAVFPKIWDPI
jgi:hypothetical protein